jgi:hypothetical protein
LGWICLTLVLIAAIILDRGSPPRKWHAAIIWTGVALFGLLIFGRQARKFWRFWFFGAVCLVLHVFMMWVIFGQLLPHLILGTLYVIPLAFIESIFLLCIFAKLNRRREP